MKRKMIKMILLTLAITLIFAGCASKEENSSSTKGGSESSLAESNSTAKTTDNASDKEMFSSRDLSAEYDSTVVTVELNGTSAKASSDTVNISGSNITVTSAGTYVISGKLTNGSIIVNASKDDKVQLVLNGASINSDTYAAIYVKQADKVFVTLKEGTENTLTNGGKFVQTDENNVDAVIFSKDDITLNGTGSLKITSPAGHGIVGKDEVTITNGTYTISASNHAIRANDTIAIADGTFKLTASEDGLHAENNDDENFGNIYIAGGKFNISVKDDAIHANAKLQIENGSIDITAAEGLEATYILINGGTININASDDGINAARKSSAYTPTVEINGGDITIVMGAGDTDGVDSNGNIVITGGAINISGQSAFDYDGSAEHTGGTLIVNGQQVDSIPNQMMGTGPGNFGRGGFGGPGSKGARG